jgi:dsDNA-specific endonuclease/ATPase MutS2
MIKRHLSARKKCESPNIMNTGNTIQSLDCLSARVNFVHSSAGI